MSDSKQSKSKQDKSKPTLKETQINSVKIEGIVLLKIIKHCKESLPSLASGQLLGLDVGTTLEISNCFPLPKRIENEEDEDAVQLANSEEQKYQRNMMKCLRDVNVDSNTVGWYQSTHLESYQNRATIDMLFSYQKEFGKKCICLVYDPSRTSQGSISLKALRLSEKFFTLYRDEKVLTQAKLAQNGFSFRDIYEELPITFTNPTVINALLLELDSSKNEFDADLDRLDLSSVSFLEKTMESIIDCTDDLSTENQKYFNYVKVIAKQQQFIQKRKEQGVDESSLTLVEYTAPSRLDSVLLMNQMNAYCEELLKFSGKHAGKLYAAESVLQNNNVSVNNTNVTSSKQ